VRCRAWRPRAPISAAVLTAPWLGTAVPRWKVVVGSILNRVLPAFPFPARIDPDTLSHDPERVADYRDDVDIHGIITPRLFTGISTAIQEAMQRGDRIDIPVHFLLAGDDRLVDTARSLAFARSLDPERVTVEVVDGLFHELLQERDRGRIMRVVRGFILDQLH
jgi:alpha-beta hydrolase superfamily lysophospholipase